MKLKLLLFTSLLFCSTNIVGQITPDDASAVLIGPVYMEEKISVSIGYAKELGSGFWAAGFGGFANTVEAEASTFKLFKVWGKLYAGPVLGGGVDWSDEIGVGGDPIAAELFGAVGGLATYTIVNKMIGAWAFWKRNIAERANDPTAGLGLYYMF